MQIQILIRSLLVLAAAAPLGAHAAPLGIKPGSWESSNTTVMSGLPADQVPAIPKEQLEKMTPEQRAQAQNMIDLRKGKPVTMTHKSCVRDTDNLDKFTANDPAKKDCTKKVISQTSTSIEVEVTCSAPHATTAKLKIEAVSREKVNFSTEVQSEGGVKVHVEGNSRWIGASCEGLSPPPAPRGKP